jgi:hypothetical protein
VRQPRSIAILVVVLSVGSCLNFAGLGLLLVRVGQQARQGQAARLTQCMTFPVSVKLYAAANRYRLLTRGDLDTYLRSAPHGCPPKLQARLDRAVRAVASQTPAPTPHRP